MRVPRALWNLDLFNRYQYHLYQEKIVGLARTSLLSISKNLNSIFDLIKKTIDFNILTYGDLITLMRSF